MGHGRNRSGSAKKMPEWVWMNPFCHYCGRRVVKSKRRPDPHHPDVGTVEHIPPRWIARMAGVSPGKVLACYPCNQRQNRADRALFPVFFVQLWNGADLPKERKMLLPGNKPEAVDVPVCERK